mgnify:CR=1 FL=1
MPNSDKLYKETNLHILENKIEDLIEVMKNLKEKNKDLQGQINTSATESSSHFTTEKKRKIKEKIENMIEELDSIL